MLGGDGMDLVLKYILSDALGLLRLHLFVPGSYGRRFLRSWGWQCLSVCGKPTGVLYWGPGSQPRVDERGGMGSHVVKSCLPALIVGWRSDGMDYSRD
jgi:hypothetical protein